MPGIEHLSLTTTILIAVIFLFAGLVHGTLGIGFPMTATPLLALLTDMQSAIVITIVPTMAVNIISIYNGKDWRNSLGRYWPMAVYVGIGSILGTKLLINLDPTPFKLLLAGVILLYLNRSHLSFDQIHVITVYPRIAMAVFGLAAGLLAGTVNVMVPLLIILFLELNTKTTVMVQAFNMCFLTAKSIQATIFSYMGIMPPDILLKTAPLALLGVITLLIGMQIRVKIDAHIYRNWMNKFLWLMAFGLVMQYLILSD